MLTLVACIVCAWLGALVGVVAGCVISSRRVEARDEERCRGHYVFDVAGWQFVSVRADEEGRHAVRG